MVKICKQVSKAIKIMELYMMTKFFLILEFNLNIKSDLNRNKELLNV